MADALNPDPTAGSPPDNGPGDASPPEVNPLEAQISELQAALDQERSDRALLQDRLGLSVAKYRIALLAGVPEVPPELVFGDDVEAIDASLEAARKTVDAVRRQLSVSAAAERVPAGAPVRAGPDLSALTPREKIALALSRA